MSVDLAAQLDQFDEEVKGHVQRLWPEVELRVRRLEQIHHIAPGSELRGDDDEFVDLGFSHLASTSLGTGSPHLMVTMRYLAKFGPTVTPMQSLLRTAIWGGAQAVWLLQPDDRSTRRWADDLIGRVVPLRERLGKARQMVADLEAEAAPLEKPWRYSRRIDGSSRGSFRRPGTGRAGRPPKKPRQDPGDVRRVQESSTRPAQGPAVVWGPKGAHVLDSEQLASMYAEVVRGVVVDESRFAVTDEDRADFAELVAEVAALRVKYPGGVFEIPNEIP